MVVRCVRVMRVVCVWRMTVWRVTVRRSNTLVAAIGAAEAAICALRQICWSVRAAALGKRAAARRDCKDVGERVLDRWTRARTGCSRVGRVAADRAAVGWDGGLIAVPRDRQARQERQCDEGAHGARHQPKSIASAVTQLWILHLSSQRFACETVLRCQRFTRAYVNAHARTRVHAAPPHTLGRHQAS